MEAIVDQNFSTSQRDGAAGLGAGGKTMGPWDLRGGEHLYGRHLHFGIFFPLKIQGPGPTIF